MPQGRRKVPFSGKKKKEQLVAKRQRKGVQNFLVTADPDSEGNPHENTPIATVQKINTQPGRSSRGNRYALQFFRETDADVALMKRKAREPICPVELKDREIGDSYFTNYDFPIRPAWNYNMSKEELDRNENLYFTDYTRKLEESHQNEKRQLSLFELNLETWRQLWRVLEISDIVLVIVDIRYPAFMFPPSLFTYVKTILKKEIILILNKIDLVKPELVVAWKHYFLEKYPGIYVTVFSSYRSTKPNNLKVAKRRPKVKGNGECALGLLKCVKSIVGSDLNLSKWEEKILEDIAASNELIGDETECTEIKTQTELYKPEEHVKFKDGVLTLGCVGFPNVGKSSIINTLKGRKVVSVSRTPGHTKYFQTIFLTDNVKLCDCPGLVFPSSTPKCLQVILGSFPIAQLRQPYASIQFVSERLNLPGILSIELPADYSEWSSLAICEAWALKKGFLTAKAARPDVYRAANNILQLVLQGRLVLDFFPPMFLGNEDKWRHHSDFAEIQKLQTSDENTAEASAEDDSIHSEDEGGNNESTEGSSDDENATKIVPTNNAFSLLDED